MHILCCSAYIHGSHSKQGMVIWGQVLNDENEQRSTDMCNKSNKVCKEAVQNCEAYLADNILDHFKQFKRDKNLCAMGCTLELFICLQKNPDEEL